MEGPSPAKRLKLMDESAPIDAMSRPGGPPSSPPPPPPASAPPPGADSFPAQFGNHSANGAGTVKVEKLDPEEEDKKVNGHTLKTDEVDAFITSAMNGEHQGTEGVKAESEDEEEIAPDDVVPAEEEDLSHRDMYLDSVSRANLDFDFERLCSKSLSNINVYACLVCGKYFQGRGKGSWAYRHAVGENHRVWLNLTTEKVSVLHCAREFVANTLCTSPSSTSFPKATSSRIPLCETSFTFSTHVTTRRSYLPSLYSQHGHPTRSPHSPTSQATSA